MPLLLNLLKTRPWTCSVLERLQGYASEEVAVAFPDEGAKKRFGGFFEKEGYPVTQRP